MYVKQDFLFLHFSPLNSVLLLVFLGFFFQEKEKLDISVLFFAFLLDLYFSLLPSQLFVCFIFFIVYPSLDLLFPLVCFLPFLFFSSAPSNFFFVFFFFFWMALFYSRNSFMNSNIPHFIFSICLITLFLESSCTSALGK